jgi:hypothetical protein
MSHSIVNYLDHIQQMVQKLEDYYQDNSIYKSIIICGDENETSDMYYELNKRYHSVSLLLNDDVYDEKKTYQILFDEFKSDKYRIFLISYQSWYNLLLEIKVDVLPYQNLLVFGNVSETGQLYIMNWLYNAYRTGFTNNSEPRILQLVEDEN